MFHSLNWNASFGGILICLVFILGCKGDKIEDLDLIPDLASNSRVGSCDLVISGRVVDTKNLQPIRGAAIHSFLFSVVTDKDGNFRIKVPIHAIKAPNLITISKEGYISQTFPVFYSTVLDLNDCPAITNIDWKIGLSARQECVIIGKAEGAWYKIMDTVACEVINEVGILDTTFSTTIYEVDVRRESLEEYVNLCISPDNSFAYGPGIRIHHSLFRVANFVVEDADNPKAELDFIKPVEIIFLNTNPNSSIGTRIPVLDLDKLTIDQTGQASIISNNKLRFKFNKSGNIFLGISPEAISLCQEFLEALKEENIETIDDLIEEVVHNLDGPTRIEDSEIKVRGIVKEEVFSNCECGQPNQRRYGVEYNGIEILRINFQEGTSKVIKNQAIIKLRTLLGDSGESFLQANLEVNLDKCTEVTVNSRPITKCVTGIINGFVFTYEAIEKLETRLSEDKCSTDTGCHQGCTG